MEDLIILQKAFEMMEYGYTALAQYPKAEKFALVVDIKRCMHKILEKIIEANKKYYKKTTLQELDVEIMKLGVKNPMEVAEEDLLWDVGITIGGGLSHMYGNMYLDQLDQLAKRTFGIKKYIRLMDDTVILHPDKSVLHKYKKEFSEFLSDVLHLRLNNKTAIRPINQGMEFVGYRIWPHKVRLRKSTSLRMKRRLKKVQEDYRNYEMSFEKANDTVMSYMSLMKHCDCEALKTKIFSDFVLTHNPKGAAASSGGGSSSSGSFKVQVSISDLYIRKGPGTNYGKNGFCPKGVYTIVETKSSGGHTWGRLKSGAGWIALEYVKRV